MSAGSSRPASAPGLVSPVSRDLIVRDLARSLAFYRDVLGFRERPASEGARPADAELVRGAALLRVVRAAPGEAVPPGVLFFETDDVAGLRTAVRARGGEASELTRVNWIKFEVFQIPDPDGHTLWFGQSFHRPHEPAADAMLLQALPELPCDDVAAAIDHYRDVLGFRVNYRQQDLGVMDRDEITLLLLPRGPDRPGPGGAEFYIRDADALHAELTARGARVQGEPVSHPWGLRDFVVLDLDGNRLTFGQPFE